MSKLTFPDASQWAALERHLTSGRGERFGFAHTRLAPSKESEPNLVVTDVELIPDDDVEADHRGWSLSDTALDRVHNGAVRGGHGLVEFHNHHLGPPGFSRTDEAGLAPMADYITQVLPDRPYGAGVYADGRLHVDYWTRTNDELERRTFRAVTVIGNHLRLLNAPRRLADARLVRQADLLGEYGTDTLAGMRVALVGAGGTGSQAAIALAYLGFRDFLILDDDEVERSNLNRLVTAGLADLGTPKVIAARRRMREVDPEIVVNVVPGLSADGDHPELLDVDLIVGCVDHDGPRNRLNQIAIDTATPYLDIATGVDSTSTPPIIGGRVVLVDSARPCLQCHGELDADEVGRWAKDPSQQALDRQHGYGADGPNPAVVHLNGLAVNAAIAELVAWVSGTRPPAGYLDIDLSGLGSTPGCRVSPRRESAPRTDCIVCVDRPVQPQQVAEHR